MLTGGHAQLTYIFQLLFLPGVLRCPWSLYIKEQLNFEVDDLYNGKAIITVVRLTGYIVSQKLVEKKMPSIKWE